MLDAQDKAWLQRLFGPNVRFDEPMAGHTSFNIGGPADAWIQPESEVCLKAVLEWAQQKQIPFMVIGGGTNLLVKDGGIRGLVIHVGRLANKLEWVRQHQRIALSAGAGVATKRVCALALKQGWRGMNFALGIPGTLGGAILMNAGTANGCMADVIDSVTVMTLTGEKVILKRDRLAYDYRRLRLPAAMHRAVLIGAELLLTVGDREQVRRQASVWMRGRARRQPTWESSAGCFFKNPSADMPAGRLIDEAGLKGLQIGAARVSDRHANFIVNRGGASAADVLAVKTKIEETVSSKFGIHLVPEVCIVGEEKTGA